MAEAAKSIPLVMAPNMSVGVNLLIDLVAEVAKKLGEEFDIEVVEAHHRHKKDAPSGTALRLAEEMAKATGRTSADLRTSRVGVIGERPRREIGVQALRGGDVIGDHTVFFFGEGERLELTHRASNRDQFGRGALRAAKWVVGRAPGLYDMSHVLKG
jgi:4-hydroxy-tetrahydrodipicolinate reductase